MFARVRRLLRFVLASSLHYSGGFRVWDFLRRRVLRRSDICVLGFHRILSEEEYLLSDSLGGIVLRETTFARILEYLAQHFHVVPLEAFLGGKLGRTGASKPYCILTFDDGWRDNFTTACPWLKKLHMPATIFLITGLVGTQNAFWVERLKKAWKDSATRERIQAHLRAEVEQSGQHANVDGVVEHLKHMPSASRQSFLNRVLPAGLDVDGQAEVDRMLTWEQVITMSRDGIEFGAHTVSHPLLPYESDADIRYELDVAKQCLEEKLGSKTEAFAYPNGTWDDRVRLHVKEAGYKCAFTTRRGWYRQGADLYTIPRVLLHEGNVTGARGEFSPAIFAFALARAE